VTFAPGGVAIGIGWTKDRDDGRSDRGCEVHWPGVAGDEKIQPFQNGRKRYQIQRA
jgi:hypothetical protein